MATLIATQPFGAYPPSPHHRLIMRAGRALAPGYIGQRVSGWLRHAAKATATQPIDVEVLGVRMRLSLDNNACERRLLVTPHFFDPAELAYLAARITPGFRFVDLGANVGMYAIFVATRAGPDAKVLAIEPHPVVRGRLRDNIALNGATVAVCEAAASETSGALNLNVDGNNIGVTSVHAGRPRRGEASTIRVETRPLLEIVRAHGFERIDALKADIEGAEDRALMPFFAAAPESLWPRAVIIENNAHEWRADLMGEFARRGYGRVSQQNGNVILVRG